MLLRSKQNMTDGEGDSEEGEPGNIDSGCDLNVNEAGMKIDE